MDNHDLDSDIGSFFKGIPYYFDKNTVERKYILLGQHNRVFFYLEHGIMNYVQNSDRVLMPRKKFYIIDVSNCSTEVKKLLQLHSTLSFDNIPKNCEIRIDGKKATKKQINNYKLLASNIDAIPLFIT